MYIISQDITLLHDHEIGLTILADFSNTTEQEADTGVLSLKSRNWFDSKIILQSTQTSSPITAIRLPSSSECKDIFLRFK